MHYRQLWRHWQTRADAAKQKRANDVMQVRPVREGEEASQFKYYGRCLSQPNSVIPPFPPSGPWVHVQRSATAAAHLCRILFALRESEFTQGCNLIVC